ncbi:MAG TPA: DinB family protein [Thermoanaerobaculia bacterium]|nr:DinB family protein [Thermoanaerobaculia bacterium]
MTMRGKQQYLDTFNEEHDRTMRVLRAYPKDKGDLRPHPKLKTARELAWVFVHECIMGTKVWHDEFAKGIPPGGPAAPSAPEKWDDLVAALEKAHKDFYDLVSAASDETLAENVHVFTGPKTMGEKSRKDWIWFLLHDQIHHRGQFSIYLRLAEGKVPSIYGPSADEPWM